MTARKLITLTLSAFALGLIATACGSNSPTQSSSSQQGPGAAAYAFARCMRDHGVSGFPDPIVKTTATSASVQQVAPASLQSSPHFKAASRACAHFEAAGQGSGGSGPQHGRPSKSVLLAFARCLRAHGITNFPDPSGQGQLSPTMLSAAGVNVHTQQFFVAGRSCVSVTHGEITVGQVAALVHHQS
jgi:hypothetical protein